MKVRKLGAQRRRLINKMTAAPKGSDRGGGGEVAGDDVQPVGWYGGRSAVLYLRNL